MLLAVYMTQYVLFTVFYTQFIGFQLLLTVMVGFAMNRWTPNGWKERERGRTIVSVLSVNQLWLIVDLVADHFVVPISPMPRPNCSA